MMCLKSCVFSFLLLFGSTELMASSDNPKPQATTAQSSPPQVPEQEPAADDLFSKIAIVEAATLHTQTLEEAPASVTVISADEIRKYGYRTLAEVLNSVRGFYFTNDRMYDYSGVRGLAIPGDFNTRFLVMLNGHSLTENVYNSNNFFGQDFGLDMDLVQRIEVIRGPNSALFGSNGMLATINVITKAPVDHPAFRASVETGSFGEKKAIVSTSMDLGHGVNLLLSVSAFNNGGRSLLVPAFNSPENNGGFASNVDAQKGYHTFANLTWGRWSFVSYFNARQIQTPIGIVSGSTFNSQGSNVVDSRNFINVSYTRDVTGDGKLRWQMNYDQYRYSDRIDYSLLDDVRVQDNRTYSKGDWVSTQLTYSRPVTRLGTLTIGTQLSAELQNLQINEDRSPTPIQYLNVTAPDRSAAVFVQQEWMIGKRLKAYLGARFDQSKNFGHFLSPRLALVYQPSERTSYKLVYGRPFRNPSTYERFYDDNGLSLAANPRLTRETAQALEVSVERKVRTNWSAIVNAFDYRLNQVIQYEQGDGIAGTYQNLGQRRSRGIEFEVRGTPIWWLETSASFVLQRAVNPNSESHLPNSPARIGKARLAVPLLRNRVFLSSGFQHLSSRMTSSIESVRPTAIADITLSTRRLFRGYDLVCGIRNSLNWQYDQPVDISVDRVRANGRTVFVKLIWQFGD